MSWKDHLADDRRRRLDQIIDYEHSYTYSPDSDQYLICDMVRWFDIAEGNHKKFAELYTPWWMKLIQNQSGHAYTCRLFKRIDFIFLWARCKKPYWENGRLFIKNYEATSIFPMSFYGWASEVQRKRIWTRIILNM